MNKFFLTAGAALGGLAIILGAFGGHALDELLDAQQTIIYSSAGRYQMYHAIVLLIVGILYEKYQSKSLKWSGYLFITGIIFFSGSLYLYASRNVLGIESWKFLVYCTPVGGMMFISGWLLLLVSIRKK